MRSIVICCLMMLGMAVNGIGQVHLHIPDVKPDAEYENISIKKIADSEDQTTYIIWVKANVRAHYHAVHTENIYIVSGTARMTLKGKEISIKPGDYLNFPRGVVHAVLEVTSEEPLQVISIQSPRFEGNDRIFVE